MDRVVFTVTSWHLVQLGLLLGQVLNRQDLVQVRDLRAHPDWALQRVDVRQTEGSLLSYECTAHRVWMIRGERMREEWLFVHHEGGSKFSYFMSNAPAYISLEQSALWRSQRYFAERTFQDAKSEAGWDELIARKYRVWIHHTALTALALWFVAETKHDWVRDHQMDSISSNCLDTLSAGRETRIWPANGLIPVSRGHSMLHVGPPRRVNGPLRHRQTLSKQDFVAFGLGQGSDLTKVRDPVLAC